MKVTLASHGGFAAGIRRPALSVDSSTLGKSAAAELERLVQEARAESPRGSEGPGRARDAMSYTVTVEDGAGPVELRQTDTSLSPGFSALMSWLQRHGAAE